LLDKQSSDPAHHNPDFERSCSMTISTTISRRLDGASETAHRFALGQAVLLTGGFRTSHTVYVITAKLPPNDGSPQYRIRNEAEGFERMAMQTNLEPVSTPVGEIAIFQ
jgi:hypothetical protein